jgi:hypothetical protein
MTYIFLAQIYPNITSYEMKHMSVITIKSANNDKGLNHKWAFCEHFDFFIKRIFGKSFFATCFFKYLIFPQ